jgi:hypothetical protein
MFRERHFPYRHFSDVTASSYVRFATVARLPLEPEFSGIAELASVVSCRPTLVLLTIVHVEPGGSQCKARHFLLQ